MNNSCHHHAILHQVSNANSRLGFVTACLAATTIGSCLSDQAARVCLPHMMVVALSADSRWQSFVDSTNDTLVDSADDECQLAARRELMTTARQSL